MNSWILPIALLFVLSCAPIVKRPIEEGISGPYTILSLPGRPDVLVVNSSTNGEFEDGSISLYAAESGGRLSLKNSYSTNRLGLSGAVSQDGKLVVVWFAGKSSELRFFSIDGDKIAEKPELRVATDSGEIFEQIKFFTPTQAAAGDYYIFGFSTSGRIKVYRASESKAERLMTLPDDMPGARPESYRIALGAPVYVESDDLLVGFPVETSDTYNLRPKNSSAYQVATGEWIATTDLAGDIRALSILVIDFNKYLLEKSVRNASTYIPFIHYDDYTSPSKTEGIVATKTARYRYAFQNSLFVNGTGCLDKNGLGQFGKNDVVLLTEDPTDGSVNDKRGNVIQLSGWAALKTRIGSLESVASDAEFNFRKKIIYENVDIKLFSNSKDLAGGNKRSTTIQILDQNAACLPIWGRIEIGTSLGGLEKMTLVAQVGDSTVKPIESDNSILPRGIASLSTNGALIFASSYSFDILKSLKFENNTFSTVP